jgi:hypothetical protein
VSAAVEQELQRRFVGPVQVFYYEKQSPLLGEMDQELAERVKQPPPLLLPIEPRTGANGWIVECELRNELHDL